MIVARNTALKVISKDVPLTASSDSEVIDFRESTIGAIQIVREGGTTNDGTFELWVSLLCDPATFAPFPSGDLTGCVSSNLMWTFNQLPFRYAIIKYAPGSDAAGTFNLYAMGKNSSG